jgi:type VI secretion system protein ImpE
MTAEELLRAGRPDDALAELQQQVRAKPADARLRVFLFQLFCIQGHWSRALNQLNVVGELDASTLMMVQTYREALRCEVHRAEVFAGRKSPLFLGQPEPWMAALLQAASSDAAGRHEEAALMRERAFDDAPTTSGSVNGTTFEWIADADTRLGPCLELIVNGSYYWVPFHRIRELQFEAPADLRDFVWLPAQVTWSNDGQAVALVPARYPGSEKAEDPALRLGRLTQWTEEGGGPARGIGQRVLTTDVADLALMDVREIKLDTLSA